MCGNIQSMLKKAVTCTSQTPSTPHGASGSLPTTTVTRQETYKRGFTAVIGVISKPPMTVSRAHSSEFVADAPLRISVMPHIRESLHVIQTLLGTTTCPTISHLRHRPRPAKKLPSKLRSRLQLHRSQQKIRKRCQTLNIHHSLHIHHSLNIQHSLLNQYCITQP